MYNSHMLFLHWFKFKYYALYNDKYDIFDLISHFIETQNQVIIFITEIYHL